MSTDSEYEGKSQVDTELQDFLEMEKHKAQLNAQISKLNEVCWDMCVDKPGNKLDSRSESCLSSCVDRFIDTSLLITTRFSQFLQKNSRGGSGLS